MFDPLSLLAGGGLIATGWLVGRTNRKPPKLEPPKLDTICSCNHGYGSHENGNVCRAEVRRLRDGCTSTYDWVPCPCLSYDGPEPLPRVWTDN